MHNDFCDESNLTNEAAVEAWFIAPLLHTLGYTPRDISLKTSIREFKIGKGRAAELYKPDYILKIEGIPAIVIDAKGPHESLQKWEHQCSSYCLELNKLFDFNPVQFYVLSNGLNTSIYQWDMNLPLLTATFLDFIEGQPTYRNFISVLSKASIKETVFAQKTHLEDSPFRLERISLSDLIQKFQRMHQFSQYLKGCRM